MNKVLGVILLKSTSRRIKNKNFLKIKKKMMFQHVLDQSILTNRFNKIFLSTEDFKINKMFKEMEKKTFYKNKIDSSFVRPKYMANDNFRMFDVLRSIVLKLEKNGEYYSKICLIYATACLLKKKDIIKFLDRFNKIKNKRASLQTITKFPAPTEWAMTINKNSKLIIKNDNQNITSDNFPKRYYDSGGLHIFTNAAIKSEKFVKHGYVISQNKCIDIDYPEDLDLVKNLL